MKKNNLKLRTVMYIYDIPQWKLAEILGVSENTVWRKLREEMSEEDQDKIIRIIEASRRSDKKGE